MVWVCSEKAYTEAAESAEKRQDGTETKRRRFKSVEK